LAVLNGSNDLIMTLVNMKADFDIQNREVLVLLKEKHPFIYLWKIETTLSQDISLNMVQILILLTENHNYIEWDVSTSLCGSKW